MDFQPLREQMERLAAWRIPGNAAVAYMGREKMFSFSAGFADVASQEPMTTEHFINIYSCSKLVTVTAALQLYEKGMLGMEDPLYAFIPEFRHMLVKSPEGLRKASAPITVRQLFTMTAGFNYDCGSPAFQRAREKTGGRMDTLELIRCLAAEPLEFDPGTHWRYSLGHDVLAAVVEVVSGKKFRHYVKENIFAPLEMTRSMYHNDKVQDQMATLYRYVNSDVMDAVALQSGAISQADGYLKKVSKDSHYVFGPEYDSGGAGITTTVEDYGKFCAALAGGGRGINGERILMADTVERMRRNQLTEMQQKDFSWPQLKGCGYGLGVRTLIDPAAAGVECEAEEFGWGGAAGASAYIDIKNGVALFYAHHMLNPQEEYYQPRIRKALYDSLKR